jgi:hypothetical protein
MPLSVGDKLSPHGALAPPGKCEAYRRVCLDFDASTPAAPPVIDAMRMVLEEPYGNPSLNIEEMSPEEARREWATRIPVSVVNMLLDEWAAAIGQLHTLHHGSFATDVPRLGHRSRGGVCNAAAPLTEVIVPARRRSVRHSDGCIVDIAEVLGPGSQTPSRKEFQNPVTRKWPCCQLSSLRV